MSESNDDSAFPLARRAEALSVRLAGPAVGMTAANGS
jgi:hypothetical protein